MKKLSKIVSIVLSLALCLGMASPAFAASFADLQNAIDGKEGTGTEIIGKNGEATGRFGYGKQDAETNKWGIEAWNDEGGTRNVQLNEDVEFKANGKDADKRGILVNEGNNVSLDLNKNKIETNSNVQFAISKTPAIEITGENTSLTLKGDGTISGSKKQFGGIQVKDGASLTMENGTITGFSGGVTVKDGSTFTMKDGSISANNSYGVSVSGDKSTFTMEKGDICNNNGNAVLAQNGSAFTMNDGKIAENDATTRPYGTVGVENAEFHMHGGSISSNKGGDRGGAIDGRNSTIDLTAGPDKEITISGNKAGMGGGIYASGSTVTVDGVSLTGNTATQRGGGMYTTDNTVDNPVTMKNVTINNNSASDMGGGIFTWKADVNISNATMQGNSAIYGAAIRTNYGSVTIKDSTIENNGIDQQFGISVGQSSKTTITGESKISDDIQICEYGNLTMDDDVLQSGTVTLEALPGWTGVTSFQSNGFVITIDQDSIVSIVDSDGNSVAAVEDANGVRLSNGKLDGTISTLTRPLTRVHAPGAAAREKEVPAQVGVAGSYEEVVYCTVCGAELSRVTRTIAPLDPPETPDDPGATIPDPDVPLADGTGTDTATIADQEVPLAGLMPLYMLLEELRQYEEIPEIELPEYFKWLDHEYAQAIFWGLREGLVVDTEEEPLDPDEVITVALLREVLVNFVEYKGIDLTVTLAGEDDEIVFDLGERLAAFYAELEAALKAREPKAA